MADPYHNRAKEVAAEAGYHGRIGYYLFGFKYIINYVMATTAQYFCFHPRLRVFLQRLRGVNIKDGVILAPDVHIDYVYPHLITIEEGACISPRSSIFAHAKASEHLMENYIRPRIKKVLIKKHAWLGAGCVILPGVTIGEGAVVISNSVVDTSVADYTMVGGIPARTLKKLRSFKEITERQ